MKNFAIISLVLGALALVSGCSQNGGASAQRATPQKLHLAFVANSPGEYWSIVNLGCQTAAQQSTNTVVDFGFPPKAPWRPKRNC